MNDVNNITGEQTASSQSAVSPTSPAAAATTSTTNATTNQTQNQTQTSQQTTRQAEKCLTRLPWGAVKEKPNINAQLTQLAQLMAANTGGPATLNSINMEKKKPGEYLMRLIVFNFAQIGAKKLEQIINGDKRVILRKLLCS